MLADGLQESGRPWDALHGAGDAGGAVEVSKGWAKVWSCDRHADELPWAMRLTD